MDLAPVDSSLPAPASCVRLEECEINLVTRMHDKQVYVA
jgi:hypothetical protein